LAAFLGEKKMQIIRDIQKVEDNGKYRAIALGTFDGVHLGHQKLIRRVVENALLHDGESMVLTFEPHPLVEIAPERVPPLLTTTQQKAKLLAAMGVKLMVTSHLRRELAYLSPEAFVERILLQKLGANAVVVGFNYTFGFQGAGTAETMRKLGQQYGFAVEIVEPVYADGMLISSTKIRRFLEKGQIKAATKLLGRPPFLEGTVISGAKVASKLGFPTANLDLGNQVLLYADGVYFVKVVLGARSYFGVANIGYKPTFNYRQRLVEVHLLDYQGDLYGRHLEVHFLERLRDEIKFASPVELAAQIKQDVRQARQLSLAWQRGLNECL